MAIKAKPTAPFGSRGRTKNPENADSTMIRVKLPPALHRKLWELRLDTRKSIQQIVTEILEEKLGNGGEKR